MNRSESISSPLLSTEVEDGTNRFVPLVVGALLVVLGTAGGASAQVSPLTVAPTPADTDSVLILHGAFTYPGYSVGPHGPDGRGAGAPEGVCGSLAAVRQAIADWDSALGRSSAA